MSYLVYFLLFPLLDVFISNSVKHTYTFYFLDGFVLSSDFLIFTNLIEINLPFFSTDILYLKLLFTLFLFMFIPFIYISCIYFMSHWLFTPESKENLFKLYLILFFYFSTFYFIYRYIFPLLITWLFTHFTSFLFFEFNIRCDIEFLYGLWFKLFLISSFISFFYLFLLRFSYYFILLFLLLVLSITDFWVLFLFSFFTYVFLRMYCSFFFIFVQSLLIYFQCSITQWKSKSYFST